MRDLEVAPTSPLAHLNDLVLRASDAVATLSYEECCVARELIRRLQFKAIRAVAERYDAGDENGFADLVKVAVGLFPDQKEASRKLGASVSSVNRWKNGSTVPHALVRVSIRGAILRLLDTDATTLPDLFDFRGAND